MRRLVILTIPLLFVPPVFAPLFARAGAEVDPQLAPVPQVETRTPGDDNWLAHGVAIGAPRLKPVGREIPGKPVDTWIPHRVALPPEKDPTDTRRTRYEPSPLMATGPDGTIYEVQFNRAHLDKIAEVMSTPGMTDATPQGVESVETAALDSPQSQFWSNGQDSRTYRPFGEGLFSRDVVGRVGKNCSGALFYDKLVLTAFHCLWNSNGTWADASAMTFAAGQDGLPASPAEEATERPYGLVPHVWKYWPRAFLDGNCHVGIDSTEACRQHDWAILVLASAPRQANGVRPGWFGYWWTPNDTELEGWVQFNRGYPACGLGGPEGCLAATQWSDIHSCRADAPGPRTYRHGCDTSPGHSGSPLYTYSPGSGGPYIVGINVGSSLCLTGCTDPTPNRARRLDAELFQVMTNARLTHPLD